MQWHGTGIELELYRISNKITDIHSLGGISDKIILILISIFDSMGLKATKVIGRELGMEDRLISIPNYKIEDDVETFRKKLQNGKFTILKSIDNLAPIEEKLYKLRHAIACDDNIQLIAMSIMSQKIALGFYNIFFEITYGKNAYVKTLSDAKILSKTLIDIGKKLMRNIGCCITSLNEPIGRTFGNILELREIYQALNGEIPSDIEEMITKFGTNILITSKVYKDQYQAKTAIKEAITSKKALQSFEKLIEIQGGNFEILKSDIKAKNIIPVMAKEEGYVSEIDVNKIRMLAKYLNAIRSTDTDEIDVGAGIVFDKKVGDQINAGGLLGHIYTNNDTKIEKAVEELRAAYNIVPKKVRKTPRVEVSM